MKNNVSILVAEDEEFNFILLKYILEREGINTIWAKNGEEAVDLFKEHKDIDLIMMDIKMPIMNGMDAAIEIKKINPGIPIIAVTAYALAEDKELCLKNGCDEFVTKPINRDNLLSITKKLLHK